MNVAVWGGVEDWWGDVNCVLRAPSSGVVPL